MLNITRIDMTMNILVADESQVINTDQWIERMNAEILDTGNAMTVEEVARFSAKINMDEFREYRIAVGRKTREIINAYTGLSGRQFRRHPDIKPETSGHLIDQLDFTLKLIVVQY
ncbi:MAG: hypothetical protein ACM3TR_16325, partial [Caulobacteraceae bacterium]